MLNANLKCVTLLGKEVLAYLEFSIAYVSAYWENTDDYQYSSTLFPSLSTGIQLWSTQQFSHCIVLSL
jgi:hypothetical protein